MSCLLGNHKLRTPASGWVGKGRWGQHRCKISQEAPSPHLYGHAPPQRRAESGRDCRTASSQVAAYGGKLRYTLSYTAAPQSSPLSDPDIQITVSTWIPCQAGSRGSQSASSVCLFFQFSTRLAWHGLVRGGGVHLVGHYPGRGPDAGRRGRGACTRFLGHTSLGDWRDVRLVLWGEAGMNGGPHCQSPSQSCWRLPRGTTSCWWPPSRHCRGPRGRAMRLFSER